MNWSMTRLASVSAFVAALGLATAQANAQQATFKLPSEARWGSTLLPPGTYTFDGPDSLSGAPIFYLHGKNGTRVVVPHVVSKGAASGRTYLELVNVDGTDYVRELVSGTSGTTLKFAVPKASHHELNVKDRVAVASGY